MFKMTGIMVGDVATIGHYWASDVQIPEAVVKPFIHAGDTITFRNSGLQLLAGTLIYTEQL